MESSPLLPQPPPGWTVIEEKGRIVYLTYHPIVKIRSVASLREYQQKGRYKDVCAEELVFSWKRLKLDSHQSNSCFQQTETSFGLDGLDGLGSLESRGTVDDMEQDEEKSVKTKETTKLDKEKEKVLAAVKNLTIDPKIRLNHKEILTNSAIKLNNARLSSKKLVLGTDIEMLKVDLCAAKNEDEIVKLLWATTTFKNKLLSLVNSKLLEQLLNLSSILDSPLLKFPVNMNNNIYSEVIDLALKHAPDFLLLIMDLVLKHENPLSEKDAIRIAYLFAQFSSSVSSKNNVMLKLKSVNLKCNGLTNDGLDCFAKVGATETSRAFRKNRDFMASISEEIFKSYAETMMSQFTFDNLDLQVNHEMHHFTLNYQEFEPVDTSALPTAGKGFEEMKASFTMDTVLMQSEQNKVLFDHFKNVTAATLGRVFATELPDLRWMLSVFPKHYPHPNSSTASRKSLIHVDKPMYLQETKNR